MTRPWRIGDKCCTKCHEIKLINEFYKRSDSENKYTSHCKVCVNKRTSLNMKKRGLHYSRLRAIRLKKQPIKWRAYSIVRDALRDGRLIRPTICSECGNGPPIEGHHHNYNKPLDVNWLCRPCHRNKHRHRPSKKQGGRK